MKTLAQHKAEMIREARTWAVRSLDDAAWYRSNRRRDPAMPSMVRALVAGARDDRLQAARLGARLP